jgi:hypothetical protein
VKFAFEERKQVKGHSGFVDLELPLNVVIAPSHLQVPNVHKRWPKEPRTPVVDIERLGAHADETRQKWPRLSEIQQTIGEYQEAK